MNSQCTNIQEITEVTQRALSNTHRIDRYEVKIDKIEEVQTKILSEMNSNIKLLTQSQGEQSKKINGIEQDVKELKEKPRKNWDKLIAVIISALVSGTIGIILSSTF